MENRRLNECDRERRESKCAQAINAGIWTVSCFIGGGGVEGGEQTKH